MVGQTYQVKRRQRKSFSKIKGGVNKGKKIGRKERKKEENKRGKRKKKEERLSQQNKRKKERRREKEGKGGWGKGEEDIKEEKKSWGKVFRQNPTRNVLQDLLTGTNFQKSYKSNLARS